jgi:hypothetical protein
MQRAISALLFHMRDQHEFHLQNVVTSCQACGSLKLTDMFDIHSTSLPHDMSIVSDSGASQVLQIAYTLLLIASSLVHANTSIMPFTWISRAPDVSHSPNQNQRLQFQNAKKVSQMSSCLCKARQLLH